MFDLDTNMHEFLLTLIYFTAVSANDSTQTNRAPEVAVNSSEFNKVKNPPAGTADLFSPVYLVTLTNILASSVYQFS